jgi:hypothetical protein
MAAPQRRLRKASNQRSEEEEGYTGHIKETMGMEVHRDPPSL